MHPSHSVSSLGTSSHSAILLLRLPLPSHPSHLSQVVVKGGNDWSYLLMSWAHPLTTDVFGSEGI